MNIIQQIFCIILFFSVSIAAKNLSGSLMTLISATWGLPSTDPAHRSWRACKLRPGPPAPAWAALLERCFEFCRCCAWPPALVTRSCPARWPPGCPPCSWGCVWRRLPSVDLTLPYRLSPSLDPWISPTCPTTTGALSEPPEQENLQPTCYFSHHKVRCVM